MNPLGVFGVAALALPAILGVVIAVREESARIDAHIGGFLANLDRERDR